MLSIFFNATPLLLPKTGIRQYAACLLQQIHSSEEVDPHYFYLAGWSSQLNLNIETHNGSLLWKLKNTIRDRIPLSLEIQHRLREHMFRRGIRGVKAGIYHELNFIPFESELPTVITIHDLSIIRFPETHPKARVKFMESRIMRGAKMAEIVVTDSEYVRQELIKEFSLSEDKVTAIPLAPAENFKFHQSDGLGRLLSTYLLQNKRYFLAVGTLEPRKNLIVAVQAHAALPVDIRKRYPMVIVGLKGWQHSMLEKVLAPLVQTGSVRVLGFVPDEHLPWLYSGSSAFIYPSLYEGFGLPPLEAMACGTPVITSDRGSLPEVVGEAGIMIDAFDVEGFREAMLELVSDETKNRQLTESGLQRSRNFSWTKTAAETIAVYNRLQ